MMRNFRHQDDHECMLRAQGGNGAAFTELVARYQDRIYRFLLRLIGSPDDARDLTQDTFEHAYQSLARWRPDAAFSSWLFRIARNLAFDQMRRAKHARFTPLEEHGDIADPACAPDRALDLMQRWRMLDAALAALPPDHREILLLREIEEMSYGEIATVLNLQAGTVKSRIARARAALFQMIPRSMEET